MAIQRKPVHIEPSRIDRGSYSSRVAGSRLNLGGELRGDPWLLGAILFLLALSVLMVFSTTAVNSEQIYGDPTSMIKRHVIHIIVGLVVCAAISRINPTWFYRLSLPILLFSILLLIAVLIPAIGHSAGGAQRWIVFGPLRMQPGEFCKLALVIYIASYIERNREVMTRFFPGVVIPMGVLATCGVLLLLEPDFGSTAVIVCVVLCQLFMVARLGHMTLVGILAAFTLGILVVIEPYRMKRFVSFLDPFGDPLSSGYQLIQSLIAVGSGGLFGVGLGAGQQKLFYLPAAHTDFIYAVIAEELGLVGAMVVLSVFLFILFRGLKISRRLSRSPFLCTLALGCTLLVVVPALLNAGVVLGLLPTKGLVLPLVAYGGTAMIVHLAAMGLLLRLSRMEP